MSDLLDRIQREIRERRAASRAAMMEYDRLQAALDALNDADARSARTATGSAGRGTRASRTRASAVGEDSVARSGSRGGIARPASKRKQTSRRAPRGANREAVLRVLADRPGITTSELAHATGIKRATLSTLLGTLTQRGEVARRELPSGRGGYALAAGSIATGAANVASD